ncbi:conjugal transfer protein [Chromobacterium violaceum]|uniref:conjugal transfer protein n=1 Tax=Chromobacterium violaceum TaxID=536 RepID=UPI000A8CE284|nr:conjugal transfer protein [Chromobacterium violaceum]
MNNKFKVILTAVLALLAMDVRADEPKTLTVEPPVVLKARKVKPYEVTSGTVIPLVLQSADEQIPVALISSDVFDLYGNVTIPKGSKLVGKYKGQLNGRHLVYWEGLQVSNIAGTLRLDPPLLATMPDGASGITSLSPGTRIATITNEPFIMPH